jgi:hypothetical protein
MPFTIQPPPHNSALICFVSFLSISLLLIPLLSTSILPVLLLLPSFRRARCSAERLRASLIVLQAGVETRVAVQEPCNFLHVCHMLLLAYLLASVPRTKNIRRERSNITKKKSPAIFATNICLCTPT